MTWVQLSPGVEQLTTADPHAVNNLTRIVEHEGSWSLVGLVWIGDPAETHRWHSVRFPMHFSSRDEAKAAATADPWIFYLWGVNHARQANPIDKVKEVRN